MEAFNGILDDLSSLLDPTSKRSQRLLKFIFHLTGDGRVRLGDGFGFPADHVQRGSERSCFARPQRFATECVEFSRIFVLNRSSHFEIISNWMSEPVISTAYQCRKLSTHRL